MFDDSTLSVNDSSDISLMGAIDSQKLEYSGYQNIL